MWNADHTEMYQQEVTLSYQGERRESYAWRPDGQLSSVAIADSGYNDDGRGALTSSGQFSRAGGSAEYGYDGSGRQDRQIDRDAGGVAVYDHQVLARDAAGRVTQEVANQLQGASQSATSSSYGYGQGTAAYALGQVVTSDSRTMLAGVDQGNVRFCSRGLGVGSSAAVTRSSSPSHSASSHRSASISICGLAPGCGDASDTGSAWTRPDAVGFTKS